MKQTQNKSLAANTKCILAKWTPHSDTRIVYPVVRSDLRQYHSQAKAVA